jgi:hypothetical protein
VKTTFVSPVWALLACSVLTGEAADPLVATDSHLKPLMRYVGDWTWSWKNEHGEAMEGFSRVTADPNGLFLIDRGGELQDGKFIGKEFNLYFWHPELRAIVTAGFTSDDEHGSSVVVVRRDQWIEQSSGFDAQGKLRTHVDQWQWQDADNAVYQETHVFRDGHGEPDDFKLSCKRVAAQENDTGKSNQVIVLHAHLQPLTNWIGQWKLDWNDPDGVAHQGRASIVPDAGGAVLVERFEELQSTNGARAGIRIYSWQPETASLATMTVAAPGDISWAKLYLDKDTWTQQISGCNASGIGRQRIGRHEWIDPDTVAYTESNVFEGGKPVSDLPKITYKRAKE